MLDTGPIMLAIPNLEIHVTHACNLGCEGCSHYSNHGHKGNVSLDAASEWMEKWSGRLQPRVFSLVGGEPTVHPQLTEFVALARRQWPQAKLRLVTNGFFLQRHPELPRLLGNDPDACLYLSIHHESPEYLKRLEPQLVLLKQWQKDYGVKVQLYPSERQWTRRYHGYGADMQPFNDGEPRASWEHCRARHCPQLFEGMLWKCAALAYLGMQNERFGLGEAWRPYLQYRPLEPDCSDAGLLEFFRREEESHCGMCPAEPRHFSITNPLRITGNPAL